MWCLGEFVEDEDVAGGVVGFIQRLLRTVGEKSAGGGWRRRRRRRRRRRVGGRRGG